MNPLVRVTGEDSIDAAIDLLLVEDLDSDAGLVMASLEGAPDIATIDRARSLADALDALSGRDYDCVLLDLGLPGVSGLDAVVRLRQAAPGPALVVLTGTADEQVGWASLRSGAQDYVVKGTVPEQWLRRAIRYAVERKWAADALRVTEERYRAVVEATNEGVWMGDPEGRTTFVNDRLVALLGVPHHELIGRHFTEFLTPRDREALPHEPLEETMRRPIRRRLQLVGVGGSSFWAIVSVTPWYSDGLFRGAFAVVTDITEWRRAEQDAHFRARLLDAVGQAVTATDPDGTITYWNRAAERMYGWDADAVLGRNVFDITPADRSVTHAKEVMELLRAGESWTGEVVLRRRDGSTFPALVTDSPVLDPAGHLVAVIGVSTDISERRAYEEKMAALAAIVESSPDPVIGRDLDGTIRTWNAAAEEVFGYSAEEIVGTPGAVLVPPWLDEEWRWLRQRMQRLEAVPRLVTQRIRKDGTIVDVAGSLSVVTTSDGTPVGFAAIVQDITETLREERLRRRLEERLHQTQRLESVGLLAGGIAHDFNNLLTAISNYADFLTEALPEGSELRADAEAIRRAGEQGAGLVHQLMAFSRNEAVRSEEVDVNRVVVDACRLLERTLGDDIELHFRVQNDLPPVMADGSQLELVVVNLALNAGQAMPDGGTIVIATDVVEVEEQRPWAGLSLPPGRYVRFLVTDDGTGMPPDVAARAFEPFFTTRGSEGGSGLGLATVYGVVTGVGGDVQIYSEPGVGTSVKVYLPAGEQADGARRRRIEEEALPEGRGERVLVVEDEDSVRELTSRILAHRGYVVRSARSGLEALAMLDTDPAVDLLLTDVMMPSMSGRQLADEVTRRKPGTRVLFVSGYTHGALGSGGGFHAPMHLLAKPFNEWALLSAIRDALDTPLAVPQEGQELASR